MLGKPVGALDKYKISDRAVLHRIMAIIIGLGLNIFFLAISRSYIQYARQAMRKNTADRVKESFAVTFF